MGSPTLTSEIVPNPRRAATTAESTLRQKLAQALRHCKPWKNREQVAGEVSELAGFHVSKRMLDDWASPSKTSLRIPAVLIAPLGRVTGTPDLEMAVIDDYLRELAMFGANVLAIRAHLAAALEQLSKLGGPEAQQYKALAREFQRPACVQNKPKPRRRRK
jgi:hypothetical protein